MTGKIATTRSRKLICVLLCVVMLVSVFLTSCEKTETYKLVEKLLSGSTKPEQFNISTDLNVKFTPEFYSNYYYYYFAPDDLVTVPEKVSLNISGSVQISGTVSMNLTLKVNNDDKMTTKIYAENGMLYIQMNDTANIVSALLVFAGYLPEGICNIFDRYVSYNEDKYLAVDIKTINLDYLFKYAEETVSDTEITAVTDYRLFTDLRIPDIKTEQTYDLSKIIPEIIRESYKLPEFNLGLLYMVFGEEDNANYLYTMGVRTFDGIVREYEKKKIDCDLASAKKDEKSVYSKEFIPLRYVAELMGKDILWDSTKKIAYTMIPDAKDTTKQVRCDIKGKTIKGTYYVSLTELGVFSEYTIFLNSVKDYVDITIIRTELVNFPNTLE